MAIGTHRAGSARRGLAVRKARVRRVEALLRRADGWVFGAEDARRLAAVRIGICAVVAVRLAIGEYDRARNAFQPHFYMDVLHRMPSPEVTTILQVGGIAAALLAMAGLALRISLPLALVCSLILDGMRNSDGRVIVGDALLMLCMLVLVASGDAASETWSIRRKSKRARSIPNGPRYGWPIRTAMIACALAYFFAALQKWRYSGLPWVTSGNLRWILESQAHPDALARFIADSPFLVHAFAAGALLLETTFPLILFVPRLRWLFVPGLIAMHVAIRIALGLDYSTQWLTVLIVFVNWPVVVAWIRRTVALAPPAPRELHG
jgi:hypothetical protein